MATDFKNAALKLAKEGMRVFPVGPDKRPRTSNGFYDATDKEEAIKGWDWNGGSMIGAAIPDGTVIIDVDPRNGGTDTLKMLRAAGRKFPPTRVVRTGGGGFHYYFTVPDGVNLRSKLGPGVDVKRAGKGYVVVPPSPGYTFISELQVRAPDWLLEELVVEESDDDTPAAEAGSPKFFPWEEGTPYGLAALEREMGRLATSPQGERNNALNKAAFVLSQLAAGGEISRKRVVKDLADVAIRIGLSPDEARGTIQSGWKAGEKVPRQARVKVETLNIETFGTLPTTPAGDLEAEGAYWIDWEIDEIPPPFYLVPILPKNAYVWVYGATEAAKSMAWMALGAEASHLGYRVSVYSLENPAITDRDRLRRLHPNSKNFRLTNQPIDMAQVDQVEAMIEREKDWGDGRGTDIVIIDTYSHAYHSRSEDGNAKAIAFAVRMRYLMSHVGCSVVVIDHTGFGDQAEPRDASAKRQQVDVAILMQKAGEWRPGQPARFTMKNNKAARFANPFYYTGEIRDVNNDIRGLELSWMGDKPRWEDPE